MPLTRVKLTRFTAFEHLNLELSPGINVFIGANSTGKTHLLKVMYAACDVTKTKSAFAEKLYRVFLPHGELGRLVHRQPGRARAHIEVHSRKTHVRISFATHDKADSAEVTNAAAWMKDPIECVYVPVKEMLANAPGFRSHYALREVHFEEVYADIIDRAFRNPLRGKPDAQRAVLLDLIQDRVKGRVTTEDEVFFLDGPEGKLEFTLLAEGFRKLGLLYRLIQNGTLTNGSVLFWDEPEANLNPSMMGTVVDILLRLQEMGVQVHLATHDYVLLKQFDLRSEAENPVRYHALYRDPNTDSVMVSSTDKYALIAPNAISDTFADLYDEDVRRALGGEAR
ncbi:MAG: AAA family ATPase [Armatimonadetes bacterium]|nr:AAA family ATPase [Armatimonadota bacterium]